MDLLLSAAAEFWYSMDPTTWLMLLGLLVSINFLRNALF